MTSLCGKGGMTRDTFQHSPHHITVFLGQDLESLCSGYLGDGAQRYPLGIRKQHQTSKGAAVVLHVLSCIYKVQSRDLKCKAPNS